MSEEKIYKIKIDLGQGLFEAEGSKEFVEQNFESFKEVIREKKAVFVKEKASSELNSTENKNKRKKFVRGGSFSIVKDLNLKPKDKKSLKKFFEEKHPETNIESNAAFVYYLEKTLGITSITPDHIFTCYKEIGLRIPGNLRQSIVDTGSSRYGYIDASNMQDIKIIVRGENLVVHDLPKKRKEGDKN
jgi:hypothetical protein